MLQREDGMPEATCVAWSAACPAAVTSPVNVTGARKQLCLSISPGRFEKQFGVGMPPIQRVGSVATADTPARAPTIPADNLSGAQQ